MINVRFGKKMLLYAQQKEELYGAHLEIIFYTASVLVKGRQKLLCCVHCAACLILFLVKNYFMEMSVLMVNIVEALNLGIYWAKTKRYI